ncbi:MAG: hypothetical protein QMD71_01060 [bacterium]|nr:hypothetical protein [bacterium]
MPKVVLSESGEKEEVVIRYEDWVRLIKLMNKIDYEDTLLAKDIEFLNSLREGLKAVKSGKGLSISEVFGD